jgi:hypothetical protein
MNPTYTPRLDWVSKHMGIEGNEKADQAANEAAMMQPDLPTGGSMIECNLSDNKTGMPKGRHSICHMMKSPNAKPPVRIYEKLGNKRKCIAWIVRLLTGHCPLNQYLAQFNIVDNATCPECKEEMETVANFLLVCPKYERERDRLRKKVGIEGMRVDNLLGDARRIEATIEFERFEFQGF